MPKQIIKIRQRDGYKIEMVEDMISFALMPFKDKYPVGKRLELFGQCMFSYESNIGTLYILMVNNRPTAFAFVLDKFESNDGVYHLHIFSVLKSAQSNGIGSMLLSRLLDDYSNDGITLECLSDTVKYFEQFGFKSNDESLDNGHIGMYCKNSHNKIRFKLPMMNDVTKKSYNERFKKVQERLERFI